MAAATIAMFQPEMATTWLTPAVVNAAARSRSTAVAQADQDPGRETGLRLRQDARRGLGRAASQCLERRPRSSGAGSTRDASAP